MSSTKTGSKEYPVVAECGNTPDEVAVTLAIYSESLEPDELTKVMGCEPTKAYKKGRRRSKKSPPSPTGAWLLKVRGEPPDSPETLTHQLFDKLPKTEGFWKDLGEQFDLQLRYGLHSENWNQEFSFSHSLIQRMSSLHVEVVLDIYSYGSTEGLDRIVLSDDLT